MLRSVEQSSTARISISDTGMVCPITLFKHSSKYCSALYTGMMIDSFFTFLLLPLIYFDLVKGPIIKDISYLFITSDFIVIRLIGSELSIDC